MVPLQRARPVQKTANDLDMTSPNMATVDLRMQPKFPMVLDDYEKQLRLPVSINRRGIGISTNAPDDTIGFFPSKSTGNAPHNRSSARRMHIQRRLQTRTRIPAPRDVAKPA